MFVLSKSFLKLSRYLVGRGATGAAPTLKPAADKMLKKVVLFILTLFICSSVLTNAQAPAASSTTTSGTDASTSTFSQVGTAIEDGLNSLRGGTGSATSSGTGASSSGGIMGLGFKLFGFFLLLNMTWTVIKGMISGTGLSGFITDFLPELIAAGVVIVFLTQNVGGAIESALNGLAAIVTGVPNSGTTSLINQAGQQGFQTLSNIWQVPSVSGLSVVDPTSWLPAISSLLYGLLAKAVAMFLILVALAVYIAMVVTSQVSVIIALILAPVFIPFLMFKPAGFLFDGWLKFFLGAGMMKVVGLLVLTVTTVMMGSLQTVSQNAITSGTSTLDGLGLDIVVYSVMILLAALSATMMASVPSIASSLMGGGNGAGFGGFAHFAKNPAMKGLTGGMEVKGSPGGPKGSPSGNALSGMTSMMPNAVKPFTAAAGMATSAYLGGRVAKNDVKAVNKAREKDPGSQIGRDTSKMSSATANSYIKRLEKFNSSRSDLNVGPQKPMYQVHKSVSSTTPSK